MTKSEWIACTALTALMIYTFPRYLTAERISRSVLRFLEVDVFLFGFWRMFIYPFFFSPLRKLPGPVCKNYLWGNGSSQFSKPPSADIASFVHNVPNNGLLRIRSFANVERLIPTSPHALKTILSDNSYHYEKPHGIRKFLSLILGEGPFMSEGELHKFQRKHLLPAFQVKHIRDLYPVFWGKGLDLVGCIEDEIKESTFTTGGNEKGRQEATVEISDWATRVTLDVIGMAAMGRDFNALRNPSDPLVRDYNELLEPTYSKGLYFAANIFGPQDLIQRMPFKYSKVIQETTGNLRRFCREVIEEKVARNNANEKEISGISSERPESGKRGKGKEMDILSILLRSNDFTKSALIDQLLTFLAAGHETTSSALTWAIYLLAVNPEWQERLRKEIREALREKEGEVDDSIIDNLPVLNAVTQETLRLYPTVPLSVRTAKQETFLTLPSSSGEKEETIRIPKGTRILISPLAINTHPEMWKDATEFKPERWLAEGCANTGGAESNYANMTFFHGERSCIGKGFAMSEFRCLLAAVVGGRDGGGGLAWRMCTKEEGGYDGEGRTEEDGKAGDGKGGKGVRVGGVVTTKVVGGLRVRMWKVADDEGH